jgi:hypothetical protein
MLCPTHKLELVCPTCLAIERGRKGGKRSTPAMTEARRRNAKRPRPRKISPQLPDHSR